MMMPIKEERHQMTVSRQRPTSFCAARNVRSCLLTPVLIARSAISHAGGSEYMPTMTIRSGMPEMSGSAPKVKRSWPVTPSRPTVPSSSPRQAVMMPRSTSSPSSTAMLASPNMLTQKISGGPKARAKLASGSARVISASELSMPPTAEDTAER